MKVATGIFAGLAVFAVGSAAFDVSCNSNYASYYGQNSARNQQALGEYCKDATEDVIVLAFMNGFPNLLLNFANACETTFDGSTLLHCPSMAEDIKYCQSQGKAVIISMGGASGSYGFSSDADGTSFANTVWDMFFKGSATQRPFDDAVLDGIDLDIEGGSGSGYSAFINQLRSHYATDTSKKYYITGAPQCPFPDAYLGSTLNSAWFDMVYVQFYNNYCGLNAYPTWFNYGDWDNWAKTTSVNKNVKIFIGAPGSAAAASSGYVDGSTLSTIYNAVRANYTSLGGIMTWDVSQARTSGLASSIRSMLNAGGTCGSNGGGSTTSITSATSTTSTATTNTVSTPATTSTDSATSSSHTAYSTEPSSTAATPTNCPVSGQPCTGSQQGCDGQRFALCNGGVWYLQNCAPGTYCYMSGSSATCDWANGRATDTCSVSGSSSLKKRLDMNEVASITKPQLRPRPAHPKSTVPTRVEFVAGSLSNGTYSTVVKVQADKQAFTGNWAISFNLPSGQTVDSTSRGSVNVSKSIVTVRSDITKEKSKNMAAIFKISGSYANDYALPDASSAVFVSV
ncbi:Chitinase 2 [Coemansia sp. RSA 1813]|nr:Chitinase 2 [Coemansia sp. RSA 1646]KAJ1772315.1 Chitinase 2 [Coemansia sp. RSA 1843]KAJ2093255.1 Chitinase 2 [Coemansia sp. RSA 986]KAJ2217480.1 Chitinase 2 [Coemansia sp. RSA 487]KAJ2573508.1 Chitinase 2 [Coemansia sp. RSA 1813]